MKRLQGAEYHAKKGKLIPIAYSKTRAGNICLYYKGGFKHYLNDDEKVDFNPEGLEEVDYGNVNEFMKKPENQSNQKRTAN